MAVTLMVACSSPKKSGESEAQVEVKEQRGSDGVQRMQLSDSKTSFSYKGKEYHSQVVRRPDDSLPVVMNEQGEKFADNRITLHLTSGGKSVLSKEFTKESFASLVDGRFLKHSILEGVVYDRTTGQGIVYAASICYPQTDLYIPLSITVTPDGKVSLAKVELLEEGYGTDSI